MLAKHFDADPDDKKESSSQRGLFYVGHAFTRRKIDDFRHVLEQSLTIDGWMPYYADSELRQKHILDKVFVKLRSSGFSIFDISELNPNVLIELGMAVGLNKPVVLMAEELCPVPDVLNSTQVIRYDSWTTLGSQLGDISWNSLITGREIDAYSAYCYFCGRLCGPRIRTYRAREACLLGNGVGSEVDLWEVLVKVMQPFGFNVATTHVIPIGAEPTKMCRLVTRIVSSRFVVFALRGVVQPESYLGLGIAMGTNTPWLIIRESATAVPSILEGVDRFDYLSLRQLEQELPYKLKGFLERAEIRMPDVSEIPRTLDIETRRSLEPSEQFDAVTRGLSVSVNGWIEAIVGSLFSGKTSELMRRVRRARISRYKVQVFSPILHERYPAKDVLISHDGDTMSAKSVESAVDILALMDHDTTVVVIDEAQEFDWALAGVCSYLARSGLRVIVAGLDLDFRGRVYGPMAQLMGEAEKVDKLQAICVVCGRPAGRTQRLIAGKPANYNTPIELHSEETFEARCRVCHIVPESPHLWES